MVAHWCEDVVVFVGIFCGSLVRKCGGSLLGRYVFCAWIYGGPSMWWLIVGFFFGRFLRAH